MEQNNIIKDATGYPGEDNLAGMLEQAFQQIGATMMSQDFAAKLLAYVYVWGGGNEAVVMHKGLNAGIRIAQQKANLYGGEMPNAEMLPLIQGYIKELEHPDKVKRMERDEYIEKEDNFNPDCKWVNEIYEKYNLKPPLHT